MIWKDVQCKCVSFDDWEANLQRLALRERSTWFLGLSPGEGAFVGRPLKWNHRKRNTVDGCKDIVKSPLLFFSTVCARTLTQREFYPHARSGAAVREYRFTAPIERVLSENALLFDIHPIPARVLNFDLRYRMYFPNCYTLRSHNAQMLEVVH